jgi:hypothetical protein
LILPPAYVINLDRSLEDRWPLAQRDIGPITERLRRVPAVDGQELPYEDVKAFHDSMRSAVLADRMNPPTEWTTGHFPYTGCATERAFQIHQGTWRGKYGCYLSHIKAVEQALDDGCDRFVIVEDDAVPRVDLLRAAASGRPDADGIFVWGGALVMADLNADAVAYWKKMPWEHIDWSAVPQTPAGIRRVFTMLAYELTRESGKRYLDILRENVLVSDCAWWQAMLEIPTYRLRPMGFGHRWTTAPVSTIGRNAPRIPVERWIETGARPEDLGLIGPEWEEPKRWKGTYR